MNDPSLKAKLASIRAERRRDDGPCDSCDQRCPCWPFRGQWLCREHFKTALAVAMVTPTGGISGVTLPIPNPELGKNFWVKLHELRGSADRAAWCLETGDRDNFVRHFIDAMIAWEGIK